jgi:Alginate export
VGGVLTSSGASRLRFLGGRSRQHPAVRVALVLCTIAASWVQPVQAQTAVRAPHFTVSGSIRTRVESWDWFGGNPDGDYSYPGSLARLSAAQMRKAVDWQAELAVPFMFALPEQAVVPGAQGALGMGANYYAANDNSTNPAHVFVKQAFVRFKNVGGVTGQVLTVGRMEFVDGTEVAPPNATLAALKRDRIAHRLLGNFIFTHVGRSFDGVQYALNTGRHNITAIAARPTDGVFQVDGWGELDVGVVYGALTRQTGGTAYAGEWRVFGLGYHDYRDSVLKTDNRSLVVRRLDTDTIGIGTAGGHYLGVATTGIGTIDVLGWGAVQAGSWGTLAHRAGAIAAEAGWQPKTTKLRPWIRGGYAYSSGDSDPNDDRHGTFFQVLPTPRVYARFPFFNLMNSRDGFGELIVRPTTRLAIRTDVHALSLADNADLWYQGGGAFQPGTFGYAGRPSNGHADLAALYDVSADYTVNPHLVVTGYFGHTWGGAVTQAIYPGDRGAQFGYAEVIVRF